MSAISLRKIKQFLKNNYISTLFENMNLIKQRKTKNIKMDTYKQNVCIHSLACQHEMLQINF